MKKLIAILGLHMSMTAHAEVSVADLAWMSGSWVGPFGERTIEENWALPVDGTIAALVRVTGGGATGLIELLVVRETDGSLTFEAVQWAGGAFLRPEPPLEPMRLVEVGARSVTFAGTGSSVLKRVTYSSPSEGAFHIDAERNDGAPIALRLSAR